METLNHRLLTVDELFNFTPAKPKFVDMPTPDLTPLSIGGIIQTTNALPDMSQPVLFKPNHTKNLASFISRNRYTLIIMSVGVGGFLFGFSIYKVIQNQKKKTIL